MRTLLELVAEHQGLELAPNQPGEIHGSPVVIKAALNRTAVILRDGEPAQLVYLQEIDVDGRRLRWIPERDAEMNQSRTHGRRISLANRKRRKEIA